MQTKPVISTKPGMNVVTDIKAGFQIFNYDPDNESPSFRKQLQRTSPEIFPDYDYNSQMIQDISNKPSPFPPTKQEF